MGALPVVRNGNFALARAARLGEPITIVILATDS